MIMLSVEPDMSHAQVPQLRMRLCSRRHVDLMRVTTALCHA